MLWFRQYVLALPAAWAVINMLSFRNPGDEYGLYVIGSLPALWVLPILSGGGGPSTTSMGFGFVGAGCMVMAALGWGMDRLRVPAGPWLALVAVGTAGLIALVLFGAESVERALARMGSIWDLIFASTNLALFVASTLMLPLTWLGRFLPRRLVIRIERAPAAGSR